MTTKPLNIRIRTKEITDQFSFPLFELNQTSCNRRNNEQFLSSKFQITVLNILNKHFHQTLATILLSKPQTSKD